MVQAHPEHDFYLFFDRNPAPQFIFAANAKVFVLRPAARHPFLWWIWFEISVTRKLRQLQADVFFSPDGFVGLRSKIPVVNTIHDINFEHRPQDLPFWVRTYYRYFFKRFAHKSAKILTVSDFSRQDIIQTYGIRPTQVARIYNGANKAFCMNNKEFTSTIQAKYSGGYPFFLYVGALHARKNVGNLLSAFELLKTQTQSDIRLMIVGQPMYKKSDIDAIYKAMQWKKDVIFAGRQEVPELSRIMAAAQALVFVPYYEGFGLPLVEAMKSGTPVICSNVSSLPEVVGDAAILVHPNDVGAIADAMLRVHSDAQLRALLATKGMVQAQHFSWDWAAQQTWLSIVDVVTAV